MYVVHEHVQCLICVEIIIKNVFEFENVFYILILNFSRPFVLFYDLPHFHRDQIERSFCDKYRGVLKYMCRYVQSILNNSVKCKCNAPHYVYTLLKMKWIITQRTSRDQHFKFVFQRDRCSMVDKGNLKDYYHGSFSFSNHHIISTCIYRSQI